MRKAAGEMLLAFCRMLGPEIENGAAQDRKRVPRVVEYLRTIKHDRVKPTREQFSATLAAFEELQAWIEEHPVRFTLFSSILSGAANARCLLGCWWCPQHATCN